ncbi:hypothetical protein G9A89_002998 [Geosiphon pyriformis]|nr:hypothetical protein G9A89_002998 [Geosiphon pyriformis]
MSRRQHSNSTSAFEIRFTKDSTVEVVEITPERLPASERHVPEPFRKRDKIPRNSTIIHVTSESPSRADFPKRGKNNVGDSNISKPSQRKENPAFGRKSPNFSSERYFSNDPENNIDSLMIDGYSVNRGGNFSGWKQSSKSVQQTMNSKDGRPGYKKRSLSGDDGSGQEGRGDIQNKEIKISSKTIQNGGINDQILANKTKPKNINQQHKNKKMMITSPNNHYMDLDENNYNKYNRIDGLSTPPDTPPSSPPITPTNKTDSYAAEPVSRKNSTFVDQQSSDSSSLYTFDSTTTITTSSSTSPSRRPPPISTSPDILKSFNRKVDDEPSPTDRLPPLKKPIIPHDEIIIPTVANRLRKKGQFSDSTNDYSAPTTPIENGYNDITDQVENLFDLPKKYPTYPRRRTSQPGTRPKTRSRQSSVNSRVHTPIRTDIRPPIPSHKQQTPVIPEPHVDRSNSAPDNTVPNVNDTSVIDDTARFGRRARREEWVMAVKDEDDSSLCDSSVKSEHPSKSISWDLQPSDRDSINIETRGSGDLQISQHQENLNPKIVITSTELDARPHTLDLQSIQASEEGSENVGKNKKDKKGKKSKKIDLEDDGIVEASKCYLAQYTFVNYSSDFSLAILVNPYNGIRNPWYIISSGKLE